MKKFWIVCSIVCFLFAILCFFVIDSEVYSGSQASFETYGGDAYTGIQNAAAKTANNVYANSEAIEKLLVALKSISIISLIIAGLYFMGKAIEQSKKEHRINYNQYEAPQYNQSSYNQYEAPQYNQTYYGEQNYGYTNYNAGDTYQEPQPRRVVNYECQSFKQLNKHSSGLCFTCLTKQNHLEYCKIKDEMGTREWPICDYCVEQYNNHIVS